MSGTVLSESRDGVRTITLNRPERLNAINPDLVADLNAAFAEANADPGTRAVIFRGAGRAFCSGDDLKDLESQGETEDEVRAYVGAIQDVTRAIVLGPKLVVGAIHGWAVGGGLEWAINCDLPIWAEGARGFFPEISWGLFVTGAATALLPRLAGLHRAKELILFGERFDARTALAYGIAWKVVPDDRVLEEAEETARRIAALPPDRASDVKRVLNRAADGGLTEAMALETEATVRGFLDPETSRRIARFGEKTRH